MSTANAVEHHATVDMGLKIKIKRKNPPAKVQEASKKSATGYETDENSSEICMGNNGANVTENNCDSNGDMNEKLENDNITEQSNSEQTSKSTGKCKLSDATSKKNEKKKNSARSTAVESESKTAKQGCKKKRSNGRLWKTADENEPLNAGSNDANSGYLNHESTETSNVKPVHISTSAKEKTKAKKEGRKRSLKSSVDEGFEEIPPKMTRVESPVEGREDEKRVPEGKAMNMDTEASPPSSPSTDLYEFQPPRINRSISDRMAVKKIQPETADNSSISETRDAGTDAYSVGVVTDPDCLGPCEPGTSVVLEGIVWSESSNGILVVNVTWRGKTYVGTLMDSTRYDWSSPRFSDESSSVAPVIETPEGGRRLRKGRRGGGGAAGPKGGGAARASPNQTETNGRRKGPARSTDSENQQNKSGKSSTSPTEEITGIKNESTPVTMVNYMYECKNGNCNKKYKQASGLLYHQTHAHKKPNPSLANHTSSLPSSQSSADKVITSLTSKQKVIENGAIDEILKSNLAETASSSVAKITVKEVAPLSETKDTDSSDVMSLTNSVIVNGVLNNKGAATPGLIDGSSKILELRSDISSPRNGFSAVTKTVEKTSLSSHNNSGINGVMIADGIKSAPFQIDSEIVHKSLGSHRNGINVKANFEIKREEETLGNALVKRECIDDREVMHYKTQSYCGNETEAKGNIQKGIYPKTEPFVGSELSKPSIPNSKTLTKSSIDKSDLLKNSSTSISKTKLSSDASGLSSNDLNDSFSHQRNLHVQNMRAAEEFAARNAAVVADYNSQTFPSGFQNGLSPFSYPIEPAHHFHLLSSNPEYREQYSRWMFTQQQDYRFGLDASSPDLKPVDMSSKPASNRITNGVTMSSNVIQYGKNVDVSAKFNLGQGITVANDRNVFRPNNGGKLQDDTLERLNSRSFSNHSPHENQVRSSDITKGNRIVSQETQESKSYTQGNSLPQRSHYMPKYLDNRDGSPLSRITKDSLLKSSEALDRNTRNQAINQSSTSAASTRSPVLFDSRTYSQFSHSSNRVKPSTSASSPLATSPLSIYPPNIVPPANFLSGMPNISSMESSYRALLGFSSYSFPDAGRSLSADGEKSSKQVPDRPSSSSSTGRLSSSPATYSGRTPLPVRPQSGPRPDAKPDHRRKEGGMGEERKTDALNSSFTHLNSRHLMEPSYPQYGAYTGLLSAVPTAMPTATALQK